MSLFTALTGVGGGDGFDFASLFSGSAGSASGGASAAGSSGVGTLLGAASSLVPGGTLVSSALGAVVGLFSHDHTPDGAGAFRPYQSPTLAALDDSTWFQDDCALWIKLTQQCGGVSVQEVSALLALELSLTPGLAVGKLLDGYREGTSAGLYGMIPRWNKLGLGHMEMGVMGPTNLTVGSVKGIVDVHGSPSVVDLPTQATAQNVAYGNQYTQGQALGTPITSLTAAAAGGGSPVAGYSLDQLNKLASDNNLTLSQVIQKLLAGGLAGVKDAAEDVALGTPMAQQAKKDYFMETVQKYQLPIAAAVVGLGALIYKAFNNK